MELISEIGSWISERESLLSGAAAIIVLLSVVASAIGLTYRQVSNSRKQNAAKDEPAPTKDTPITLKELSAPCRTPVEFAESDGLRIAYTVLGEGPPDIVMAPGIISHLNITSHLPPIRDSVNAVAEFARVLRFDKRGQGLSDPTVNVSTLDERVHDIQAVIDAAGMDKVILYGISESGPMCLKFAHDHPERVKGLVLLGTTACWVQSEDFPIGIEEKVLDSMTAAWGSGQLRDVFFPEISREVMDEKTSQGFERLIASRESIRQIVEYMKQTDVRPLLPNIHCPTLVVHFGGDLTMPVRMGRAVAAAMPNAEFLEVSGTDHADLSQSAEGMARVREFVASL
jgi:pimeloyl-ACP methyl ester carboxylesterase